MRISFPPTVSVRRRLAARRRCRSQTRTVFMLKCSGASPSHQPDRASGAGRLLGNNNLTVVPMPTWERNRDRSARLSGKSRTPCSGPRPVASTGFFGREERLECAGGHLGRHSDPRCRRSPGQQIPRRFAGSRGQPPARARFLLKVRMTSFAAVRHGIASVEDEVDHRELELSSIGIRRPQIGCKIGVNHDGRCRPSGRAARSSGAAGHSDRSSPIISGCRRGESEQLPGQTFSPRSTVAQRHIDPGLQLIIHLPAR